MQQIGAVPRARRRRLAIGCGGLSLLLILCLAVILMAAPVQQTAQVEPTPTQAIAHALPTTIPTQPVAAIAPVDLTEAPTGAPTPTQPPTAVPEPTEAPQPTPTTVPAATSAPEPTASRADVAVSQPPFSITAPKDGATVRRAALMVKGTGAPGAEITHDISFGADQHAIVNSSGKWQMRVELIPDENELKFRQEDAEGAEQTLRVTYRPRQAAVPPKLASTPTPRPTKKPAAPATITLYVNAAGQGHEGVNLRAKPSRDAATKMVIPNGASIRAVKNPITSEGEKWYRVSYKGDSGFAVSSLLSRRKPEVRPTPTPTPRKPEVRPTPTPTPRPAGGTGGIRSITVSPDPMIINDRATITANVSGSSPCSIEISYPATGGTARDEELQGAKTPSGGRVSWTYDVGTGKPGSAVITVTCGTDRETVEKTVR